MQFKSLKNLCIFYVHIYLYGIANCVCKILMINVKLIIMVNVIFILRSDHKPDQTLNLTTVEMLETYLCMYYHLS